MDLGLPRLLARAPSAPARVSSAIDPFRLIELAAVLALLVFLLPLMATIVLLMALSDPGPVLFRQQRIGRGGVLFPCLKFRSMVVDADARLQRLLDADPVARREWDRTRKLTADPRITPVGAFLRRSSLDELPQLLNVLRGEMSLVGPRPIVPAETVYYGRYLADYCRVRPGISGLWQVSGRSDTTYRRRVACDVLYSRRRTWRLDLRIAAVTVPAVLAAKGAR